MRSEQLTPAQRRIREATGKGYDPRAGSAILAERIAQHRIEQARVRESLMNVADSTVTSIAHLPVVR